MLSVFCFLETTITRIFHSYCFTFITLQKIIDQASEPVKNGLFWDFDIFCFSYEETDLSVSVIKLLFRVLCWWMNETREKTVLKQLICLLVRFSNNLYQVWNVTLRKLVLEKRVDLGFILFISDCLLRFYADFNIYGFISAASTAVKCSLI